MIKIILGIILLSVCSFAATYTDNFSSSNSNWTTITNENAMAIGGGTFNGTVSGARNGAYYNAASASDSQYVSFKINYAGNLAHTYITVRTKADVETYYLFGVVGDNQSWRIASMVDGSSLTLASGTMNFTSGSTLGFSVSHDTLIGYINGVALDTVIDNSITGSGYGGVFVSADAYGSFDDFYMNDVSTLGTGDEEGFDSTEIIGNVGNTKECPTIVIQPESDTVAVGSILSFIVQANGSALTYQWKLGGVNVGTNANYYQRTAIKADTGNYVKCVISGDTCSPVTTDSVLVSVTGDWPTSNPPVITVQPHDSTVTDGATVSFSVTATNATGYQWYGNGSLISGATNSTYSFTATYSLNGSSIYCLVYNTTDTISTDTVTLTVNAIPAKTPAVITVQPINTTVTAGQSATFFVTASGSGLTYQWYRNDSLIAGATNDTFTYTSRAGLGYTDNVYCALTTDTTISTDTVTLTVISIPLPVISQSTDTLKLHAKHTGTTQWLQNGSVIGSGPSVSLNADSAFYAGTKIEAVTGSNKSTWQFKASGNKRSINFK